ncbi:hypothetical protein NC653_027311 [Populus alba x Populus x berolinensis]|uniref:Uncharacterized protein n=1 Tax=Populus alba x Populus x berolinensis TaxID=444605 RepID=A0AAD6M5C1_9ROSI|nr:hypothetical protein NC653_027311 [Populus alba x Populus x berolinensis]
MLFSFADMESFPYYSFQSLAEVALIKGKLWSTITCIHGKQCLTLCPYQFLFIIGGFLCFNAWQLIQTTFCVPFAIAESEKSFNAYLSLLLQCVMLNLGLQIEATLSSGHSQLLKTMKELTANSSKVTLLGHSLA